MQKTNQNKKQNKKNKEKKTKNKKNKEKQNKPKQQQQQLFDWFTFRYAGKIVDCSKKKKTTTFQRILAYMLTCHFFLEIDPCAKVSCLNGGNCQSLEGGKFECACLEGFTGEYCETSKLH